jgi:CxxC motif-containing protein (DUF1111 family)
MRRLWVVLVGVALLSADLTAMPGAQPPAKPNIPAQELGASDPGVRRCDPPDDPDCVGAGGPVPGLTPAELQLWIAGLAAFSNVEGVLDGLGPRFNLDNCLGCHSQPAIGGTSPAVNPQVRMVDGDKFPGNNLPFFITSEGPAREARIVRGAQGKPDGGVVALFTITGHGDAAGCELAQPDFAAEAARNNLIFRIPTPVFGAGLIEAIPDHVILENQAAASAQKAQLGILGRPGRTLTITGGPNRSGNDGTITRFGWKAQNKSLDTFAAEAYNVEMGISNEGFPTERDETGSCQFMPVPNDALGVTDTGITISDVTLFAFMMRTHAAPTPVTQFLGALGPVGADSIGRGRQVFEAVGCALCHTPTLHTENASIGALRNQPVHLFSDLLLHHMGPGLADGVLQGIATGDEFRTAPLWGLGQRIFLLHDGRTTDLLVAIREHGSGNSEASKVIKLFEKLSEPQKQDLLNFLRSL